MMEETMIQSIKIMGFPIFMCVWFMFRMEKFIGNNTKAMKELIIFLKGRR